MATVISGDTGVSQVQAGSINQDDLAANVVGKGPAFRANSAPSGAMVVGSWAKLVMSTEVFDTANAYDSSLYRFTPQTAGYYQVNCSIKANGSSGNIGVAVYKNGSMYSNSGYLATSTGAMGTNLSDLVYLNGTTDYIEMYGYSSVGNSTNEASFFSGYLARAA